MGPKVFDKKRKRPDGAPKPKVSKKQVRNAQAAYHSSSEEEDEDEDEVEPIINRATPAKVEKALDSIDRSSDEENTEDGIQLPGLSGITGEDAVDTTLRKADDDDYGVTLGNADESLEEDENDDLNEDDADSLADSDGDSQAELEATTERKTRKRNDPTAFATSISKILGSKLTAAKRADPVLSRSKDASAAAKDFAESKLEAKARRKLRDDKRTRLDRGRVKDVLGINLVDTTTAEVVEHEKRLKKTAQRGVIKLFNAVRAAQVKADEAAREVQTTGVVGVDKRQEKVNEMSKKGFLDLLVEGGN